MWLCELLLYKWWHIRTSASIYNLCTNINTAILENKSTVSDLSWIFFPPETNQNSDWCWVCGLHKSTTCSVGALQVTVYKVDHNLFYFIFYSLSVEWIKGDGTHERKVDIIRRKLKMQNERVITRQMATLIGKSMQILLSYIKNVCFHTFFCYHLSFSLSLALACHAWGSALSR